MPLVPAHRAPALVRLALWGALALPVSPALPGPRAPAPLPPQLEALRVHLAEQPEGPDDLSIRVRYALLLDAAGQPEDAFEEYLTVVRRAPDRPEGKAALGAAAEIARRLALTEPSPGLWTERWAAAADRYTRYWPGDPLALAWGEGLLVTWRVAP